MAGRLHVPAAGRLPRPRRQTGGVRPRVPPAGRLCRHAPARTGRPRVPPAAGAGPALWAASAALPGAPLPGRQAGPGRRKAVPGLGRHTPPRFAAAGRRVVVLCSIVALCLPSVCPARPAAWPENGLAPPFAGPLPPCPTSPGKARSCTRCTRCSACAVRTQFRRFRPGAAAPGARTWASCSALRPALPRWPRAGRAVSSGRASAGGGSSPSAANG